jgi:four helix bundle protein
VVKVILVEIFSMEERKFDLEDRLIDFTCRMIEVVESLPKTRTGNYIAGQLIRSCHSPAFNYGEVQAAESTKDFIHKLAIVLKELKECRVALKIIIKKKLINPITRLKNIYDEGEELVAIFGKSIKTARQKLEQSEAVAVEH